MKIEYFPGNLRGVSNYDWLKSRHSFSFGNYFDQNRMGFGSLRVINDDVIAPGSGFPPHSHKDMEIFTIPLAGSLYHKDSTGKESVIKPGDIQIMSAGYGVTHSEFNNSKDLSLELLQIWIQSNISGVEPRHEEKSFLFLDEKNKLHEIINPHGENGTLHMNQNAYVSLGLWNQDSKIDYKLHSKENGLYIFLIDGDAEIENAKISKRDALGISEVSEVNIHIKSESFILLMEVPMV